MLDNKAITFLTAIGAVAVFIAIARSASKEDFWNIPSRTWRVEKVLGIKTATPDGCVKNDFFQTPNFQSLLAPRFSNVDYGPYLRTQLPDYSMMGVPQDPLNKECPSGEAEYNSYQTSLPKYKTEDALEQCSSAPKMSYRKKSSCDGGPPAEGVPFMAKMNGTPLYGAPVNPRVGSVGSYANGNYQQVKDQIAEFSSGPIPTDTVVEGSRLMMGADGEMMNPIVYDRYTVANRNSRLRAHGDKIRGDLPIAPNSGNWFTPNVHPNIDLEAGAINVLAGVNNDTSKQLANLIYNTSGRADTAIGGVDMAMASYNSSNQTTSTNCAAGGDLMISAFP